MSDPTQYDKEAIDDAVLACRRFIEDAEQIPAAAIALLLPALMHHLEERLADAMMEDRALQLGRELTDAECEREAAFVGEELIRAGSDANDRMPELLERLRADDTSQGNPDPREPSKEQMDELFTSIVSNQDAMSRGIRVSKEYWSHMAVENVDLDTRLLLIAHVQSICGRAMMRRECSKRRMELGRHLTEEDLDETALMVMRRRKAIERIASARYGEIMDIANSIDAKQDQAPARALESSRPDLRYIN
jgi:hypothetical protein